MVIQNILHLFLIPDKVSTTHAKAKLMVYSLRSSTLPLQYISLLSILASALLMTLQRFGMICLMMYVRPLLSTHSEGSSKPISSHKHIHPNFYSPWFLSMALTLAMSQVYDYSFLLLFGALRVCHYMEIKRYKNTIRIMARSKVKSRSHHGVPHLHLLINVPTRCQLPTPYGFGDIAWTNFFLPSTHPTAYPDTRGENNTLTVLKGSGVKTSFIKNKFYFFG